ncbi:MAG: hypothetical protein KDD48_04380, partial [Bdellovibrionales bacterium]|nr:hypothetical protein [Bdellovibrionales bacterium]
SDISKDKIKKFFEKEVPVSRIDDSDEPSGYFVYVDSSNTTEDLRKKAIDTFDGKKLGDTKLKVAITNDSVVQVKALDERRIRVKLTGPIPYFLYLLEFGIFAPSPKHVIEKMVEIHGVANQELWTRPENIVCSSAHCLSKEQFRQYKIFTKNPFYWNADQVKIDRIKVYSIESFNATLFFYQSGEIDWTGGQSLVPSEYIKFVKHLKDYSNDPYLGVYFYGININKKPLDDVRVRQALSLAIDRKALTDLLSADQLPFAGMVPDGLAGYKALDLPLFDPDRARAYMAEAGFPNGSNFPEVSIMYNTTELHKQVAETIQQMWKKNLGINIKLQNKEWKVYLDDMTSRNYEIVRRGWIGDFPDPYTFLELMLTTSGNNRTGWSNKAYDALIREANKESDLDKRLELMRQAEAIAMEELPFIPLYVYTSTYFKKPYLKGFWPDMQNHHLWKHWWIDERWYEGEPVTDESLSNQMPSEMSKQ